MEALADEDETLDWRGTITVDGETGKDYEVEVRTILGEGDALGWSREVVPLPKRGVGGQVRLKFRSMAKNCRIANLKFSDGTTAELSVDSSGYLTLDKQEGLVQAQYFRFESVPIVDNFYLTFDPIETCYGQSQRLVNLGYITPGQWGERYTEEYVNNTLKIFAEHHEILANQQDKILEKLSQLCIEELP